MDQSSIDRPSVAQRFRALGVALELAPTHIVALLAVASCAAAGLVGLWWTAGAIGAPAMPAGDIGARSEPAVLGGAPSAPPDRVVVHVSGAVASPGVRRLDGGARVDDAVRAAGGVIGSARTEQLNLARVLRDGEQIHVPDASEAASLASGASGGGGPLNINRATSAELESLPGVGPVLAARIVAQRESTGGFRTVSDLQNVPGIGDKTFAELQDLVTV